MCTACSITWSQWHRVFIDTCFPQVDNNECEMRSEYTVIDKFRFNSITLFSSAEFRILHAIQLRPCHMQLHRGAFSMFDVTITSLSYVSWEISIRYSFIDMYFTVNIAQAMSFSPQVLVSDGIVSNKAGFRCNLSIRLCIKITKGDRYMKLVIYEAGW